MKPPSIEITDCDRFISRILDLYKASLLASSRSSTSVSIGHPYLKIEYSIESLSFLMLSLPCPNRLYLHLLFLQNNEVISYGIGPSCFPVLDVFSVTFYFLRTCRNTNRYSKVRMRPVGHVFLLNINTGLATT